MGKGLKLSRYDDAKEFSEQTGLSRVTNMDATEREGKDIQKRNHTEDRVEGENTRSQDITDLQCIAYPSRRDETWIDGNPSIPVN